jgi:hypothetical protein
MAAAAAAWRQRSVDVGGSAAAAVCHQRGSGGQQRGGNVPLFITHDEYFVRCGGNGGGYYDVFDLSSYELLSGQK